MSILRDEIYITIIRRIISIYDPNENRYMPPRYKMRNPPLFSPIQTALFGSETYKLHSVEPTSAEIEKREDEESVRLWNNLYGRISPEEYAARSLIYATTKNNRPLFSTVNAFRIRTIVTTLNNIMLSPEIRDRFVFIYSKFQRTYRAFNCLARVWRIRHTPVRINTDLYMNEIDPKSPTTYYLINNQCIYYFTLHNLVRIIVDAITHQQGMFVEPLVAKNPYTNEPIKKIDLFNIYFRMKANNMKIPEFFEKFFLCEFNVFEFRRRHETLLRDNAIQQYVKNTSAAELYYDVNDMLSLHRMTKLIHPDVDYPRKNFVKTMMPFLKLYFAERYSLSSIERTYSGKRLKTLLKRFAMNNPLYGKKMLTANNTKPNPIHAQSNFATANHPAINTKSFHETVKYPFGYCSAHYMESHIYDETIFERYLENGDMLETYYIETSEYEREYRYNGDVEQSNSDESSEDNNEVAPEYFPSTTTITPLATPQEQPVARNSTPFDIIVSVARNIESEIPFASEPLPETIIEPIITIGALRRPFSVTREWMRTRTTSSEVDSDDNTIPHNDTSSSEEEEAEEEFDAEVVIESEDEEIKDDGSYS